MTVIPRWKWHDCTYCGKPIKTEESEEKHWGKYYHARCWRSITEKGK